MEFFKVRNLSRGLMFIVMLFAAMTLYAQSDSFTVSGTVKDKAGEVVFGATILDTKTHNGTVSDMNGKFSIVVIPGSSIKVSYIGYTTAIIPIQKNKKVYDVVLDDNSVVVDELVVVGYGVQKKQTLTGSVAAVTNKDIVTTKNENLQNMLTGKIAGLRVVQNSSEPGSFGSVIDIRGMGNPLVVIDGIPRDNMARIDPEDVESISVLKDASASIYGVRAANGVILVTTKKGAKGKAEISYSGSFTWQKPSNFPEMVTSSEWMTISNERSRHNVDGGGPGWSDEQIANAKTTDWKSAVLRNTAPQTQHTISISGGTDKVNYYASVGYQNQGSFLQTNAINYDKYSLRSNISAIVAKGLKVDFNLSGLMDEKKSSAYSPWDVVRGLWLMQPMDPVYQEGGEGRYTQPSNTTLMNPVAMMDADAVGYNKYKSKWFQSSIAINYELPWVQGLKLKALYSYDYILNDNKSFTKQWNSYRGNQVYTRNDPAKVGRTFYGKDNNLWQIGADYARKFNDHNVAAMILLEQSKYAGDNFNGNKELSIPIDQVFAGNSENQYFGQSTSASALFDRANRALIGRAAYDYKSKYLIEFAFRYEGSSMFPSRSRWALFPSISGGWRVSEESFWQNSVMNVINNFKIRGSWGKMGDDSALAYQFLTGYNYPAGGGSNSMPGGAIFDDIFVNSSSPKGLANNNISWITAKTWNVGLDLEAFKGKLGLTADYFRRDRDGLLATRDASLPGIVGAALPQENLNGDFTNGFEIELSYRDRVSDFAYEIKGNMSYARSMNKHVEGAKKGNSYLNWKENSNDRYQDLWWGYGGSERLTSWDQIYYNDIYVGRGSVIGDYNYEDWNGDGQINDLDVHPLTNSGDRPLINFALTLNGSWRGIDLSILLQGAANRHISYSELLYEPLWANTNALSQFMDRWHPADSHADPYDPSAKWVSGNYGYSGSMPNPNSTYNMQNAAYLRLKTIELGYSLPQKWINKIGAKNVRVYLSGYNLLTITGLKYCDPEFPSSSQGYNYPLNKTITVGANIKF
ncbi:MAG: TonB-dependent receptor [Muribaculaceae bacterium]